MSFKQVRQNTVKTWNERKIRELNDEQLKAVNERNSKSICVVAGAGSGKTRVLTYRFLDLIINDGHRPREIACLTYTTAAADEMKDRIIRILVDLSEFELLREIESAYISTIHAFALRLISENSIITGFNTSNIDLSAVERSLLLRERYDELSQIIAEEFTDEQNDVLNMFGFNTVVHNLYKLIQVIRDNGLNHEYLDRLSTLTPAQIVDFANQNSLSTDFKKRADRELNFVENVRKPLMKLALREFVELKKIKQEMHRIEFIDYLESLQHLLNIDNSPVKSQFKEVLVDEFQDTNSFQYKLIRDICGIKGGMFAVGDAKQSIYRFQQAEIEVFANFANSDETKLLELTKNYRSHQNLIEFCNQLFKPAMTVTKSEIDFDRIDTPLVPGDLEEVKNLKPRIELLFINRESLEFDEKKKKRIDLDFESKELKAEFVARRIFNLVQNTENEFPEKFNYKDIAILVRKKSTALKYRSALEKLGIPALIFGGMNLLKQPVVLDVFYVLKLFTNPTDDINFASVLKTPFVGVSDDVLFWLSKKRTEIQRLERKNRNDENFRMSLFETALHLHKNKAIEASKMLPDNVLEQAGTLEIENFSKYLKLLDDFLNKYIKLKDGINQLNSLEIIDLLMFELDLTHKIAAYTDDRTAEANFYAFRDFVKDLEQRNNQSFSEFVNYLQKLIDSGIDVEEAAPASGFIESERDAVKIMTIHKAKGLEFPAVFVVETEEDVNSESEYDIDGKRVGKLYVDREIGLYGGYYRYNKDDELKIDDPFAYHADLSDRSKRKNLLENFRLFYVAMTRAEKFLFIAGSCKFEETLKEVSKSVEKLHTGELNTVDYKFLTNLMVYSKSHRNFCQYLRRLFNFNDSPYFEDQRDMSCDKDFEDFEYKNLGIRRWFQIKQIEVKSVDDNEEFDPELADRMQKAYEASEKIYESQVKHHNLSAIKLSHVISCPKMYKFSSNTNSSVSKKESVYNSVDETDLDEDNDAKELGISFHKTFEKGDYSSFEALVKSIALIQERFGVKLKSASELEALTKNVLEFTNFWNELCSSSKVYTELPIFFNYSDITFRGVIDLLAEDDERLVVVDFKTDKNHSESMLSFRYKNQIKLYCFVLMERMRSINKHKKILYSIFSARSNQPPKLIEYDTNAHEEMIAKMKDSSAILKTSNFKANITEGCTYCIYAGICKDYKQGKIKRKRKSLFE